MSEPNIYTRRIECQPDDVDAVHNLLNSIWIDRPKIINADRFSFETALVELTSNVIQHGDSGAGISCLITINAHDDRLEATLIDNGQIAQVELAETTMPGELAESGRGIPLIKALVDSFSYHREKDHNKWQIARKFTIDKEATRLAALDFLKILDTTPEEGFDRITRLAKQLFGVEMVAIVFINNDRQWVKSTFGMRVKQAVRGSDSFSEVTIRASKNFTVTDARQDSRFKNNPYVTGEPYIRFYAGYPIESSGGERVGALCIYDSNPRIFTEAEELLLRDLALLVQKELVVPLWVQKEMVIENELNRAAQVQKGLLPKQPEETFGFDVAGGCVQARTIGGDFYDWYPVNEGGVLTLADVMGKGMGAAIIAATVRAVLRAGSGNDDIVSSIEAAAAILGADLNSAGSFVTLFHARLNVTSGLVRYVDAGHGLSIVIRRNGEIERLSSDNPPLGVGINATWEEDSFVLNPGDTLISVSDGVLDLFDGTLTALNNVAEIARSSSSAQEIVDAIVTLAGRNASDDVTVLVLRRNL